MVLLRRLLTVTAGCASGASKRCLHYRPYSGEVIRKVGLTGDVAKRVIHLCRQEGTFYILYRDFLMQKDMLIDQDYDGPFSMYLKRNAVRLDR